MTKGTIIYLGGFELPDGNAAAHRVLSNAKIFRELGYQVIFIDVDKSLTFENNILNTMKNVQGFDCWSVGYPRNKKNWIKYLTSIADVKKIYSMYSDIKFVICYNYQSVAFHRIIRLSNKKNIKVISDCTEWYSPKGNSLSFFLIKGLDTFYRMQILNKNVDGLIIISDFLENYYSKQKNIINIPPLIDLSEPKWNTKRDEKTDISRLIYAGTPGDKDKINIIIDTLEQVNEDFVLDIIGITKKEYLEKYSNDKIKINKMKEKINFRGRLTHIESLNYVKNADYSCFVREDTRVTRAGFPTKFVESISCGTPVITNDNSNIKKYLIDENNGYLIDIEDKLNMLKIFNRILTQRVKKTAGQPESDCLKSTLFDYQNYIQNMEKFINGIS